MSTTHGHFRPRRGVGTQALLLSGATAFSLVATAVMYIIAARRSVPEDFGLVVAAIAAGTTVTGLVDFGSNAYWTREIARGAETARSLSVRATSKLLTGLVFAIVLGAAVVVFAPSTQFWIAGLIGCGLLLSQTSQVPLAGAGRADLVAIPLAIDRLLAACILVVLTEAGVEAPTALWIALIAGALSSAVVAQALTPRTSRFGFRFRFGQLPWAGARSYGFSSLAVSAQSLDVTLLSAVGSPSAAAMYGAVSRWTQPMGLMARAFATSAAPFIANSGEFSGAWRQIKRALWFPVAAIAISVLIAAAAPLAVHVLLGDEYKGSAPVLRLLALAAIPSIVNQVWVVALQSLGHDRAVGRIVALGVFVHLALVCALSPTYGAIGAAVALTVMQCLVMVVLVPYAASLRTRSYQPIRLARTPRHRGGRRGESVPMTGSGRQHGGRS